MNQEQGKLGEDDEAGDDEENGEQQDEDEEEEEDRRRQEEEDRRKQDEQEEEDRRKQEEEDDWDDDELKRPADAPDPWKICLGTGECDALRMCGGRRPSLDRRFLGKNGHRTSTASCRRMTQTGHAQLRLA